MFIEQIKNNGKPYLRLVHAVRKPNKNGDMVSTKQVILNIGPLDRFDDGDPDYLYRLKNSFKAGNPLIPALLPYCSAGKSAETYRQICDLLDIDEYINYMALECYIGPSDWITNTNNIKGFRSRTDGKFHFVFFDAD